MAKQTVQKQKINTEFILHLQIINIQSTCTFQFFSFTLPHLPCKNHQDMGFIYISGGLVLWIILELKC